MRCIRWAVSYTHLDVYKRQANRRVIEALIKAGAFDATGYPRRQLMHFVDRDNPENIIDAAVKRQKDLSLIHI